MEPIILQFSTDGGITWTLISTLSKDVISMKALPQTQHFTISLPGKDSFDLVFKIIITKLYHKTIFKRYLDIAIVYQNEVVTRSIYFCS